MTCAPSEDSDQPRRPPSLIRVFLVHMKKRWVLNYSVSEQRKLRSDWADAQADLSLRWVQRSFCLFCHEAAHMVKHTVPILGLFFLVLEFFRYVHYFKSLLWHLTGTSLHKKIWKSECRCSDVVLWCIGTHRTSPNHLNNSEVGVLRSTRKWICDKQKKSVIRRLTLILGNWMKVLSIWTAS